MGGSTLLPWEGGIVTWRSKGGQLQLRLVQRIGKGCHNQAQPLGAAGCEAPLCRQHAACGAPLHGPDIQQHHLLRLALAASACQDVEPSRAAEPHERKPECALSHKCATRDPKFDVLARAAWGVCQRGQACQVVSPDGRVQLPAVLRRGAGGSSGSASRRPPSCAAMPRAAYSPALTGDAWKCSSLTPLLSDTSRLPSA